MKDVITEDVLQFILEKAEAEGVAVILQGKGTSEIKANGINYVHAAYHILHCIIKERFANPTQQDIIGLMTYLGNMLIQNKPVSVEDAEVKEVEENN